MEDYKILCIEKMVGYVELSNINLFLKDVKDQEELEYWEDRLDSLKHNYAVLYRKSGNKILYSIFANTRSKGSKFK